MEASRHTWWKILNPTFVPPPCALHLIWNGTIRQPHPLAFAAQFSCRILILIRAIHLALNLVEENLGPQSQSRFDPSKGSLQQLTRNQRRDKNCPPSGNSNVNGQGRSHSWPTPNHLRSRFQCPQFWWLWWRCRISSCFRSWHWSQLWPSWRVNIPRHHSSWYLHTYFDSKSQGTGFSHVSNPSAKSNGSTSWSTIPSMDQRRWSRADEYETGHKVPSFLEDDRCQTSSRSPGMQIEMGHPETNAWDFWPTRSCQPTPRTRGGRLTNIIALSMREKSGPACCFTGHVFAIGWVFLLPSFLSLCFLLPPFLCLSLLPLLVYPQQIWLIHQLTDEPFLNALVRGTTLCGTVTTHNNVVDDMIQDLRYLLHLVSGKYLRLWIFNLSVHLWPKPMMMSWMPRHAMFHRPWAGWKKEPCSLTMSYSILTVSNPSLCTTFSIASASTSGTPGITTCPRLPWTSDGKTKLEIPLLSATKTDLLIFFMIFVLIGLKAKNWAFYFPMIFDLLRLTFSLISCAWAAMKPFPIAICFHETVKKVPFAFAGLFLVFCSCSCPWFHFP